jgi:hypothetical protein
MLIKQRYHRLPYTLHEIKRKLHVLNMEAEGASKQALEINSTILSLSLSLSLSRYQLIILFFFLGKKCSSAPLYRH